MNNISAKFQSAPSQFKIAFLAWTIPVIFMLAKAIMDTAKSFKHGVDSWIVVAVPVLLVEFFAVLFIIMLVFLTLKDSSLSRIGGLLLGITGTIYSLSLLSKLIF